MKVERITKCPNCKENAKLVRIDRHSIISIYPNKDLEPTHDIHIYAVYFCGRCYHNPTFTPYLGNAEPDEKIEIVEGEI